MGVRCDGMEGVEQSSGTVWQRGGGVEGWRSHLPGGGCWIERRWRRCGSVGVIGWERGGQPRVGGRRGGYSVGEGSGWGVCEGCVQGEVRVSVDLWQWQKRVEGVQWWGGVEEVIELEGE